jgi:hypothetical protein
MIKTNKAVCVILVIATVISLTGGFSIESELGKIRLKSASAWFVFATCLSLIYYLKQKSLPIVLIDLHKKISAIKISRKNTLFTIGSIVIYLTIAHYLKHLSFNTHGFDMTFVQNSISNPFGQSGLLSCTVCLNSSYMGEHISPSLLILSPIDFIFKSDFIMFLTQTIILLLPVIILIRNYFSRKFFIYALIGFLSIQSYRNNFIWDLREDIIAFTSIILFLIFLEKRKIILTILFFIISIISKEQVGILMVFFLPVYLLDPIFKGSFKDKAPVFATLTFLCIGWSYVTFAHLMPYFTMGKTFDSPLAYRFGDYGSTSKEIMKNILFNHKAWIDIIGKTFNFGSLKYLFSFTPFAYFLYKKPLWLLPIVPSLIFNMIGVTGQRMLIFHYDLTILCFLFYGISWLFKNSPNKKPFVYSMIIALCISGKWTYGRIKLPTVDQIKDYFYITNLKQENIATSLKTSALIARKKRIFILPESISNQKSSEFNEKNILGTLRSTHQKNKIKPISSNYYLVRNSSKVHQWYKKKFSEYIVDYSPSKEFVLIKNHLNEAHLR